MTLHFIGAVLEMLLPCSPVLLYELDSVKHKRKRPNKTWRVIVGKDRWIQQLNK